MTQQQEKGKKPKIVKSLDDLSLPEVGAVDIPRVGGQALRVPIKAIGLERQEEMAETHKAPAPPVLPKPNPETHKMEFIANEEDPAFKEALSVHNNENVQMLVVEGLGIDIPGNNLAEKWKALRAKLAVGDLTMILGAILEMSNVGEDLVAEAKNSLNQS